MTGSFLFGVSLMGSFLSGVLALFAPCCITFLFPSYLGTIFKKSDKVLWYTLVFSLGLATILVPVAVGFRFIVVIFDAYHGLFYYLGALMLIIIGWMTLGEVKLPFSFSFTPKIKDKEKIDAVSVYSLGVMSGLTSSCCAPVLLAAVTLTSLSPTILQAVVVALAYVLGIIFPLFLLSLAYERVSVQVVSRARRLVYKVFKLLGGLIFIISGVVIAVLNWQGKIVMMGQEDSVEVGVRLLVWRVSRIFSSSVTDTLAFLGVVAVFWWLIKRQKARIRLGRSEVPKPESTKSCH